MRLLLWAWLAALLLLLASPSRARAEEPAVISVPPRTPPPPANPKLRPEADVSRFVGKPITSIEVSLDDETWHLPEMPKVTSVRPGQTMSGQAARRAMDDVLESGMFARARIAAVADGAGVKMVVHVVQRRLVELLRLDLHGAPLERDELLREADLLEGGEILGTDIPEYQERLLRYLARRGYPTASVTLTTRDTDDPARVMVIVDIAPGGPRVLQRRVFYVFGAESRVLHPVLEDYRVTVGDRCDENAFDAADAAMAAHLRSLGYQRAELSHDLVFADNLV
ncbi:MAG TPA: POTRA domain-containing protein, partial [Polyangiaceae bacterium]